MSFITKYGRLTARPLVAAWVAALILASSWSAPCAWAQAEGESTALNYNIVDLIQFGGWVGYVIIFLSVIAVALVIEYALSIRTKTLMPEAERANIALLIEQRKYDEVVALGQGTPSFLAGVVASGIKERDRGFDAMVKAMEDTADGYTGKMLRRIEHLNIIANIAPMLGLLGTVMGMVNSFNQISIAVGGVDPRRLAGGIFEALMTTVMGLIVAIPALWMFGFFRNRVDGIVHESTLLAEEMVEPFKPRGVVPSAMPPPVTSAEPPLPSPNSADAPAAAVKTKTGGKNKKKRGAQTAAATEQPTAAGTKVTAPAEPVPMPDAAKTIVSSAQPVAAVAPVTAAVVAERPEPEPQAAAEPKAVAEPTAAATEATATSKTWAVEAEATDESKGDTAGDGWSLESLTAELTPDEAPSSDAEDTSWSLESLISETGAADGETGEEAPSEWASHLFDTEEDGRSLLERLDAEAAAVDDEEKKGGSGGGAKG